MTKPEVFLMYDGHLSGHVRHKHAEIRESSWTLAYKQKPVGKPSPMASQRISHYWTVDMTLLNMDMAAVYLEHTNYTGPSNSKKDVSHVQKCPCNSSNCQIVILQMPNCFDDNKSKSLQKVNALYNCGPCRDQGSSGWRHTNHFPFLLLTLKASTALSSQLAPLAFHHCKRNVMRHCNTNMLCWLKNQTQWRFCIWNLVNNSWMEYSPTQSPIAVVTL